MARNRLASARRARSETRGSSSRARSRGIERADQQQQDDGDDEIDRRPGDGDGEFLRRLFRQRLQAGDAADRQQRHFRRLNAVAARDEDVAELMQHDADEQQDDEDRLSRAAAGPPCCHALKPIQASSSRKVTWIFTAVPPKRPIVRDQRIAHASRVCAVAVRRSVAPTLCSGRGIIAHRPRRRGPASTARPTKSARERLTASSSSTWRKSA